MPDAPCVPRSVDRRLQDTPSDGDRDHRHLSEGCPVKEQAEAFVDGKEVKVEPQEGVALVSREDLQGLDLLPDATVKAVGWVGVLAIIAIVYGALVAMAQKDMKKLVAYSSVSHMGFIMRGMFALNDPGLRGAILQMLNHGASTGALFLLVGIVYERRHNRLISEYGGIAKVMPMYATFFLIITMSSIGLPTLNGFIGEFLVLAGTAYAQNQNNGCDHPLF